ncbi:hypothetical protein CRG98_008527 [Punica granatum]|uniref:Uncharacterized protein n=1 Tax=Punica granatum TaxID=22663 RepID=A0A2I0KRE9_PUNGR|nr:hypothetical protein CRG98_008527 [Punica granatum]
MAPRKLMIQEPKEVARFDGAAANPNLEKQPMVYTGSKARRVVAQEVMLNQPQGFLGQSSTFQIDLRKPFTPHEKLSSNRRWLPADFQGRLIIGPPEGLLAPEHPSEPIASPSSRGPLLCSFITRGPRAFSLSPSHFTHAPGIGVKETTLDPNWLEEVSAIPMREWPRPLPLDSESCMDSCNGDRRGPARAQRALGLHEIDPLEPTAVLMSGVFFE